MTYFYKVHGTIARKIGGEPPANEYVAIDPKGMVRHIKDGYIIEEKQIEGIQEDYPELKELYDSEIGKQMARSMLITYRKKKTMKPKAVRKVKVGKKCKCK